jgi:uncharacterized protein involved in outer membrane biogenesis
VDEPLVLGGQFNLFVDLRSRGHSAQAIVKNLEGEAGFVLEGGRIRRAVELLASDALDFLFTGTTMNTYTDLNCAAFRMVFEKGKGDIQVLYLDTPGIRAGGQGDIDLPAERISIVIDSKSKRRFVGRASPVRISGTLQNPSVIKVPADEAALLAGQVFFPYVAIPARALGFLWSMVSADPEADRSPCIVPPNPKDGPAASHDSPAPEP